MSNFIVWYIKRHRWAYLYFTPLIMLTICLWVYPELSDIISMLFFGWMVGVPVLVSFSYGAYEEYKTYLKERGGGK